MATTPSPGRHDPSRNPLAGEPSADPTPMGSMQDPLPPVDRAGYRTSDDNDVNLRDDRVSSRTTAGAGRGFATTFIIAAAVLVVAFLVALYFGSSGTNVATNPADVDVPVAGSTPDATESTGTTASGSGTAGSTDPNAVDTTGSTTTPPASGTETGTGTGTTAPANP
ncbi:hypothetical protein [Aestuariivirga sp.]|uniref:hypothetical protein n=1 Tax=Aestuariivirga sp. TaxID=2650926 RepID=UPI00391CD9DC